jgi:uncharacterized protein YjbI with pentapeptide repeats
LKIESVWKGAKWLLSNVWLALRAIASSILGWLRHLGGEIAGKQGWLTVGKGLATIGGAYGLMIATLTYQSQVRNTLADNADRAYLRLVDDFASSSEHVRISAMTRAPSIMARERPLVDRTTMLSELTDMLRGRMRMTKPFINDVRRLIHAYMARGAGVTIDELEERAQKPVLQRRPAPPPVGLSSTELDIAIDTLVSLGTPGWDEGNVQTSSPKRTSGLAWLGRPGSAVTQNRYGSAATLFEGTTLIAPIFSGFRLPSISFRHSRLDQAAFTYSLLDHADFNESVLDYADASHASLVGATFNRASLQHADLSDALLFTSDFRNADLRDASLRDSRIRSAKFFYSRLDGANLSGVDGVSSDSRVDAEGAVSFASASMAHATLTSARLPGSDFHSATLDQATLDQSVLDRADLSFTSLRNASLAYASLRDVDLTLADLTGADLQHSKYVDTVSKCRDANIADVRGLSAETKALLISRGAVTIPLISQWIAYKAAGRPHQRWRDYAKERVVGRTRRKGRQ